MQSAGKIELRKLSIHTRSNIIFFSIAAEMLLVLALCLLVVVIVHSHQLSDTDTPNDEKMSQ